MAEASHCPHCGKPLPLTALPGLCPECMLKAGLPTDAGESGPGGTRIVGAPPHAPAAPAEIAKHFPQLEILECLGRGGMGVVYRARQPHLNRLVALKILAPEKETDPAFAERFTREAQALARLNHPNIVTVYDFGRVNGLFYLLMEFVDGANLRELLQAGRMQPEAALAIVPKICEALQFAHEHGVVHRDIKPENVLLDKQGRVKIADFGIAKIIRGDERQQAITQDQQVIGTPHYMAPEQIEKPQTVDHRADIYSLGVVFYEMLTGELPLGKFGAPSSKVQVDVRLDQVVLHALEKDRERRYQHASEVKTDVETIAGSPAASSPSGNTPSPAPVLHGRDRWLWERHVMAFGFLPAALLLALMPLWFSIVGARAAYLFPLLIPVLVLSAIHAWIGHRVSRLKAGLPRHEAEIADAWIAWEQGMWPFNRSQGLALLYPDRLELIPVWYGGKIIVPLADIASVREVRWVYVPLFWKHGFALQLANGQRVAIAVPAPFGCRWRARLSRGKLPELPTRADAAPGEIEPLVKSPRPAVLALWATVVILALGISAALLLKSKPTPALGTERFLAEFDWRELADQDGLLDGVLLEVDGRSALKIENTNDLPLQSSLLRIEKPPVTGVRYALSGEIRYENVQGDGYLELWNYFPPAGPGLPEGQYFSRTLAAAGSGPMGRITGTSSWRALLLPFDRAGTTSAPTRLELNVFLPGRGVVFLRSLKLVEWGDPTNAAPPGAPGESSSPPPAPAPPVSLEARPEADRRRAVALFNDIEDIGHEFDAALAATNLAAAQTGVRRWANLLSHFNAAVRGTQCEFPPAIFDDITKVRQALDQGDWRKARILSQHNEQYARVFRRISDELTREALRLGAAAPAASHAPPVVIRTVPESGTTDVDPGLGEIRVTFSKPMQDGSWSWSTWGDENYPEIAGKPKYLEDQRTCVLPVRLARGKVYALWLNSEKFQNFKDQSELPAVPYLLIFETRK